MSPFENISVDFLVTLWRGKSRRTVGNRRSGDRLAPTTASSKARECMLLALLGVSLARESPSCCDGLGGIQDSQPLAVGERHVCKTVSTEDGVL